MTGPRERLATTKTDRLKKIKLLQAMGEDLKYRGNIRANCVGEQKRAMGFKLWDEAHAIRWALSYVGQHVNLETGELTISLEPEETA